MATGDIIWRGTFGYAFPLDDPTALNLLLNSLPFHPPWRHTPLHIPPPLSHPCPAHPRCPAPQRSCPFSSHHALALPLPHPCLSCPALLCLAPTPVPQSCPCHTLALPLPRSTSLPPHSFYHTPALALPRSPYPAGCLQTCMRATSSWRLPSHWPPNWQVGWEFRAWHNF